MNKKDKNYCRQFGIILSIILFFLSALVFQFKSIGSIACIILGMLILITSFITPGFYLIPCFFWAKFGNLIGHFASFLIIGFLMYIVITPLKIMFRLNSDNFNKSFKKKKTYWLNSKNDKYRFKIQY